MAIDKTIYTIMTCKKLEIDKNGFPDFGCTNVVGWYFDKKIAFERVKENACDINETCYDYAVIEAVTEGLYQPATANNRWFFKYNKGNDSYEEIPEPDKFKHFCGFTIG